ncbi:MAG: Fe-S cluster assembly ATPase SufC [Acidimicrobiales bacterium]|jgi:Fe-S cluster assembly ATP-binding protein|nr:Fe-S cluster assembly ATPase SufC [Acidimicrobiales bacterium]MDP7118290.1 Fe-S cluster assembly ATPase SufC [Acidimicrobiales bacterium]MDP7411725.1 Fe-S cluster assembly ATPase SufC [Acidimicrobiales bacterium]MEE1521375.1 Fe-S cluster assembly ATPase SufC [Acidimicrobiales bacterium]MEE1570023.1 Fe-S cluster assembly ATPase SufC [Acidimicrobiales bacterium]
MTTERVLRIEGLCARVGDTHILGGIDLEVRAGEVHAIMGPNGSGKSTLSHVLMGRSGYEVTAGSVTLDGTDLLGLAPWERAQAGLFLALQHPTEVPGVSLESMLVEAAVAGGRDPVGIRESLVVEAERIGFDEKFLDRPVNVDLSGGEKKRNEALQMSVIRPRYAVLDEIDSGLDVDALSAVARRVEDSTNETGLGVLVITHFSRLLEVLQPDRVHVLSHGRIHASGGPELAERLEAEGYTGILGEAADAPEVAVELSLGPDPFADPLA